jgi:hypothetical protein
VADKTRMQAQACQSRGTGVGRLGLGTGAAWVGVRMSGAHLIIIRLRNTQTILFAIFY